MNPKIYTTFFGRLGFTYNLGVIALIATSQASLDAAEEYWKASDELVFLFPQVEADHLAMVLTNLADNFLTRIGGAENVAEKEFDIDVHAWFSSGDLATFIRGFPQHFSVESLLKDGSTEAVCPSWYEEAWDEIANSGSNYMVTRGQQDITFMNDLNEQKIAKY